MSDTEVPRSGSPSFAVVVLSQGNRPAELLTCLDSLLAQRDVELDIVVVGNGWKPTGLRRGVRRLALAENIGIPAGRNVGADVARGEYILFFDDDAWVPDPDLLARVARMFGQRPGVGAVQPRIADTSGLTLRRWVPRVRVGDPGQPGPAFRIQEGVIFVRRAAFEAAGGWPGEFFYGHEGIELAWRMQDAGWDLHYAGELTVHHPATSTERHAEFYRLNARNRVWAARRNLPVPLVAVYLAAWTAITAARLIRQPRALRTWCAGFLEGWRTNPGGRRPMRWGTVARLTRLGHPPII